MLIEKPLARPFLRLPRHTTMKKELYGSLCSIFLVSIWLGCANTDEPSSTTIAAIPSPLSVSLQSVLIIGDDENAPPETLLGRPKDVRTDSRGTIYVSDLLAGGVKVFNAAGDYVRTIGQRGQGPGEFTELTHIYVDDEDYLLVTDMQNARISKYSPEGELVTSFRIDYDVMRRPRFMGQLSKSRYVLMYRFQNGGIDYVAHLFDSRFNERQASFIPLVDIESSMEEFVDLSLDFDPGRFAVVDSNSVLYVPSIYRGKINRYSRRDGKWLLSEELPGYSAIQEPLRILKGPDFPRMAYVISARGTQFAGFINNESLGLYILKNQQIVHFTRTWKGNRREFGVELFDPKGDLLGYGTIPSLRFEGERSDAPGVSISWMDQNNQVYIISGNPVPLLEVYKLSLSLLTPSM